MNTVIGFSYPVLLSALLALPLFWWVLSALPPKPVLQVFPPIRYLLEIKNDMAEAKSIPLWLRILRVLMVVLLILAFAGPILNPPQENTIDRPVLILIDDGWANAANWANLRKRTLALINQANLAKQPVALVFLATDTQTNIPITFAPAHSLRTALKTHLPKPFAPDRAAISQRITQMPDQALDIYWFSDGLDYGDAAHLTRQLDKMGRLHLFIDTDHEAIWVSSLETTPSGLNITLNRNTATHAYSADIIAEDRAGAALTRQGFTLKKAQKTQQVSLSLPRTLRNRIGAVRIANFPSAGAVQLVDSTWVKPDIAILGGRAKHLDQPLLSEEFYLTRALSPFGNVAHIELTDQEQKLPPIVILLDTGKLGDQAYQRLRNYVENGGMLLRFAGPRLAARQDDLLPVSLRTGDRLLGSSLGWDEPQQLRAFADTSPFFGLDHHQEVNIRQQVLADSVPGLAGKVWARLTDGTPLVTAAAFGRGQIVLFHTTAAPNWSDLPLSGLFVQMLQRIVPLAGRAAQSIGQEPQSARQLQLSMALNAHGQLHSPNGNHKRLDLAKTPQKISPDHPAGLWKNAKYSVARNVVDHLDIAPFPAPPARVKIESTLTQRPIILSGFLFALVFGLLILDHVFIVWLGRISRRAFAHAAILLAVFALGIQHTHPAMAGEMSPFTAVEQTRLAFVRTGIARTDRMSQAGLKGLSRALYLRTTVEPGAPQEIDLERDDINTVSFLYWPVLSPITLSDTAAAKLNTYLKTGGMLIIDTQDGGLRAASAGGVDPALRSLFSRIDVPALAKITPDHVLTRAYYLIDHFPGRYSGAALWVEADQNGSALDGVSSLVIGAHDWAAAWAIDQNGKPMAGIENKIDNGREMSKRFGINLVMYGLAGNYKADQVHIPALLERLGK